MSVRIAVLVLGVGLLALPAPVLGQGITAEKSGAVLAEFEEATALAVDPRGRLYVTDAGRDVVVVLTSEGRRLQTIGGSGARAGEFDLPSDVDPTNGQVIAVADTYNGRVQRFTEEGQYLESLPVGAGEGAREPDRSFEDGRDGSAARGDGRPISVASTEGGGLVILDEARRLVYQWTDLEGLEPIIEGSAAETQFQSPVSLAVGANDRIYVADAGHGEVFVYDRFGTYVRALPTPRLANLKSIAVARGMVWMTCADRLVTWDVRGRSVRERAFALEETLVEIVPYSTGLYVLTENRLIRYSNG